MGRVVQFVSMVLVVAPLTSRPALGQEWGFSSPEGAVVKITRDQKLNVTGEIAFPSSKVGGPTTVPVTGRNEPGKLILEFDDPQSGIGQTITYERGGSPDGSYRVWSSEDAPETLGELRSPINASSEPAKAALESWSANTDAVVPVEMYSQMVKAYRAVRSKEPLAESSRAPVAIITDRLGAAAWDGAASRIGTTLTSVQTFSTDGVLFTMEADDLVAALGRETDLLQEFGGVTNAASRQRPSAVIPIAILENVQPFWVPLANMFHTYEVENSDISKIETNLNDLFARLRDRRLECAVGETGTASFSVGCLHHCGSHNLRGNFLVNTIFSFGVGVLRNQTRQIFVMSDSWAASAKIDDPTPGQDRFTHHRSNQAAVQTAHGIALSRLRAELGDMFKGFRSN